ncbi:proton-conducting transporter transmembrane domain-containing protein [Humisphaera borealis]|uniref:Probable inorganic carbon transporter subunit DabB n=1 Tax=Humisphaera borealis TaxID=2807512 RepID=A0A7M2WZ31_9BACT|nr:proton-conducting transporter membrane subunit [Humisphaera borealis]QOV89740.1 oxidoreductase [Humisphaera borealis]
MALVLAGAAAAAVAWQAAWPQPLKVAGFTIDRLSATLALLVGLVGAATYRFSTRYLDDAAGRRRFLRWLLITVCAAYALVLSTDLLLLFAAWSLTSAGLHRLLTFYPDRPQALAPARKKFVISRLGDVALLAAIALIWRGWGTTDLHVFIAAVREGAATGAADWVAMLVAVAALTKSAQFPFHSWLPETMESPTPVSALMHAGIINAGGVLLLRFAPLLATAPAALTLLVLIGTLTAALGTVSMWSQVKVKRQLAWSTVAQMGFMMVQCGLTVFPAAALHIVGHGCYKAWSFLRSGGLPASAAPVRPASPVRTLALAALGTLLAIPALRVASSITGFDPSHSPGEMAMSAVVAIAIGQLWVGLFRTSVSGPAAVGWRVVAGVAATFAAAGMAFGIFHGVTVFLAPALGPIQPPTASWAWVLASIPVLTFAGLAVLHACLPALARTRAGRALYVHALHGFYFGAVADRAVERLWPIRARKDVALA